VDEVYSDFTSQQGPMAKKKFGEFMKMAGFQSVVSHSIRIYRCLKKKMLLVDDVDTM